MKLTVRTCIPVRSATSFVALVTVFLVDLSATARLTVLEARTRTVVITVLAPYLLLRCRRLTVLTTCSSVCMVHASAEGSYVMENRIVH